MYLLVYAHKNTLAKCEITVRQLTFSKHLWHWPIQIAIWSDTCPSQTIMIPRVNNSKGDSPLLLLLIPVIFITNVRSFLANVITCVRALFSPCFVLCIGQKSMCVYGSCFTKYLSVITTHGGILLHRETVSVSQLFSLVCWVLPHCLFLLFCLTR